MELFADSISINCRKVIAGLALLEVDYSLTRISFFEGEQKSPEYLNPHYSWDGEHIA